MSGYGQKSLNIADVSRHIRYLITGTRWVVIKIIIVLKFTYLNGVMYAMTNSES
jgi:hypothetical protein